MYAALENLQEDFLEPEFLCQSPRVEGGTLTSSPTLPGQNKKARP